MIRQAVFALVLGLPLYALAQPSKAVPPPSEIPVARLTADSVVSIALGAGSAASADAVWFLDRSAGSITRVDAKDNKPAPAIVIGAQACGSLVVAFDSVWAPMCGDGTIVRVDAKSPKVTATLKMKLAAANGQLAAGVGSLWALTNSKGVLSRIDPDNNAPVAEIYVAAGAHSVVLADSALWITSDAGADKGRLTRVNPHSNEVIETIDVGPKPGRLVVGEDGVWTLNRGNGTVTRVDPATNKVVATITVGDGLADGEIAAGLGSVWISAPGVPLVRIDPRTNRAVQRFTGAGGGAVLVAHGSLWLAAGPQLTWRLDPLLIAALRP